MGESNGQRVRQQHTLCVGGERALRNELQAKRTASMVRGKESGQTSLVNTEFIYQEKKKYISSLYSSLYIRNLT